MIQDDPRNRTRFIVISQGSTEPTGHDRTSLALAVHNKPAAVYEMLTPLVRHGVSMTRFESRPAKNSAWEYIFYIDIQGHLCDAPVAAALAELSQNTIFMKVLGAYPCAPESDRN
jgi:chorismate mutase/prephenate dehydratase